MRIIYLTVQVSLKAKKALHIKKMDEVILVDESDNPIGTQEKMLAHEEGNLHRCFSIFLVNNSGEILLQRRAANKYHCGSMWTNTCCSHQRPGENTEDATQRRLREELGIYASPKHAFSFVYKHKFDNGLTEHEYDHVCVGKYDGEVNMNPEEVEDFMWVSLDGLKEDILRNPKAYTPWLKIILNEHLEKLLPILQAP